MHWYWLPMACVIAAAARLAVFSGLLSPWLMLPLLLLIAAITSYIGVRHRSLLLPVLGATLPYLTVLTVALATIGQRAFLLAYQSPFGGEVLKLDLAVFALCGGVAIAVYGFAIRRAPWQRHPRP